MLNLLLNIKHKVNVQLKRKVSHTGYRILLVLELLLKRPVSKNEIILELGLNPYVSKVSKDSVRLDINTLKEAGFVIKMPLYSNGYRYELDWSPIKFRLTQRELDIIDFLKKTAIELSNWQYIVKLFAIFEKITKYMDEDDCSLKLMNFEYFLNVDFKLLKELNTLTNYKSEVLLLYNSPNTGTKEIKLKLQYIKYDGGKLHLYGKSSKYPNLLSLRLDHIIKVVKIVKMKDIKPLNILRQKKVKYKITPNALETFELFENETVISKKANYIEIEATIENEFMLLQRLLSMGENLMYIENDDIRRKLVKTLKTVRKIYNVC